MENFIFLPVNFFNKILLARFLTHLHRRAVMAFNDALFKSLLLLLESKGTVFAVFHFGFGKLDFAITFLYFSFESFKVLLVLLFELPILES